MNRPTDSVRIVFFDREAPSPFLVLAETDDPDNWKLPGGKFASHDEAADLAASRELLEELGLIAEEIGLHRAGELRNDDGVSARYIFWALMDPAMIRPSEEIAAVRWATETTVPDGPNRDHMLSAVALARTTLDD